MVMEMMLSLQLQKLSKHRGREPHLGGECEKELGLSLVQNDNDSCLLATCHLATCGPGAVRGCETNLQRLAKGGHRGQVGSDGGSPPTDNPNRELLKIKVLTPLESRMELKSENNLFLFMEKFKEQNFLISSKKY